MFNCRPSTQDWAAEYERYFPLKELGVHCEVAALTVNEMVRSPQVLTPEAADALDDEFEQKIRGLKIGEYRVFRMI